jgi:hypothetical protein
MAFACQARRSCVALAFANMAFACQARRSCVALAFGDVTGLPGETLLRRARLRRRY